MIFNESVENADFSKYDVIILDPPFDLWNKFSHILSKIKDKRIIAFTNFQNREYITDIMGTPRIEIIWCFNNGKWVSHNMPQLCHENILIYGDTNEFYLGEENKYKPVFKTSIGKWKGLKVWTKPRKKLQLKTFFIENRIKIGNVGSWGKPRKLIDMLINACCYNKCNVLDAFAGSGGILRILKEYDLSYDCYEINADCFFDLKTIEKDDLLFKNNIKTRGELKYENKKTTL